MDNPTAADGRSDHAGFRKDPVGSTWRWLDERLGLNAFHYPVPAHANGIMYTLGGVTLMGFIILGITGFLMSQYYHPAPNEARESVIYLVTRVDFGNFIRSVHFWAANLVVITMFLHLSRVFISGSYKKPRELNWLVGVGLLALTFGLFFTGTVLKWDQEAAEALKHNEEVAKLLGNLGTIATNDFTRSVPLLTRLYLVHTSILPGIFTALVLVHMFLVKYHKISPLPVRGSREEAGPMETGSGPNAGSAYFSTHMKDLVGYGMIFAAFLALLAVALPTVLGPQPIAGIEVTKPSWVFWWTYAFENWFGIKALIWAPPVFLIGLALVPFLDRSPMRHILDRRWIALTALAVILGWIALTIFVWVTPTVEHLGG